MVFAFLAEDSEGVRKDLASIGFDEIQLPKLSMKVSERIDELRSDLAAYKQKVDEVVEKVKSLTQGHRARRGPTLPTHPEGLLGEREEHAARFRQGGPGQVGPRDRRLHPQKGRGEIFRHDEAGIPGLGGHDPGSRSGR